MKSVMIDLETLATSNNAAIVAIGAVEFDRFASEFSIIKEFYHRTSLKAQLHSKIDYKTLCWWMRQSEEARLSTFNEDNIDIFTALDLFHDWCVNPAEVWSKGANFDIAVLEEFHSVYKGFSAPWSYKATMCYRTLLSLNPGYEERFWDPYGIESDGKHTKHDALADAKFQAYNCWFLSHQNIPLNLGL